MTYRLYFLGRDSHIRAAVVLDCETDADAEEQALTRADGRMMEVWDGARLVRRFPAPPPD